MSEPPPDSTKSATLTDDAPPVGDPRAREQMAHPKPLKAVPFEEYDLQSEHARGGLGMIMRARDRLGRIVAVKQLLHPGDAAQRRFEREARLTARLQHPSIVPIHEAGRWPDGTPFYSMKLVAGRSLKEVIAARATLDERIALLPHVIAVAEAIAYAHSERVIHRDLKPSNVLIGDFGETVVVDWGLAKDLDAREWSGDQLDGPYRSLSGDDLTHDGAVLGTPAYMPPEQARGEEADERADVYALGALMYHVLSGHSPYSGPTSGQVLRAVLGSAPQPLVEREPGVPRDLAAIVEKAMRREKEARYRTADEFLRDLLRFQAGQLVSAHHYSSGVLLRRWSLRYRLPLMISLGAIVVLAIVAIGAIDRVVRARRLAVIGQKEAEVQRSSAELARATAEARAGQLILSQASGDLARDPTSSLAWLKTLQLSKATWIPAQNIAADAASRGISKVVAQPHHSGIVRVSTSSRTAYVASAGNSDGVRVTDMRSGQVVFSDHASEQRPLVSLSADGSKLFYTARGRSLFSADLRDGTRSQLGGKAACVVADDAGARIMTLRPGIGIELRNADGSLVHHFQHLDSSTRACTLLFTADGAFAVASDGQSVVTLDIPRAREQRLARRRSGVVHMQRTPTGFVIIGSDSSVDVCSISGCVRVGSLGVAMKGYVPVAVSANAEVVAMAFDGGGVRVLNWRDGQQWNVSHVAEVTAVSLSDDGRMLAIGDADGVITLIEPFKPGSRTLIGHRSMVTFVKLDDVGRSIVSSSLDGSIRLWDIPDHLRGQGRLRTPGHFTAVREMGDGRIVLATGSGEVIVAGLDGSSSTVYMGAAPATALAVDLASNLLAVSFEDGLVVILDTISKKVSQLHQHRGSVWAVAFTAGGSLLVSVGVDGRVVGWSRVDGSSRDLFASEVEVAELAASPDGRFIAAGDRRGRLWLWDSTGHVLLDQSPQIDDAVQDLAFLPDSSALVVGRFSGATECHDIATKEVRDLSLLREGRVLAVAVHRNGLVASGGDGGAIVVVRQSVNELITLSGHSDGIRSLSFSPDGRFLASGSLDRTVRVWDLESGAVTVVREHNDGVAEVLFSQDGLWLFAVGFDGLALHWPVSDLQPKAIGPAMTASWVRWLTEYTMPALGR